MNKLSRRLSLVLLSALVLLALTPAFFAGASQDYTPAALSKAEKMGKVVVLEFHASWCPTCRKQAEALEALAKDQSLSEKVAIFKVDYDDSKELKKKHRVSKQSTLIVLKGGDEVARATGITAKADIRALIEKAL